MNPNFPADFQENLTVLHKHYQKLLAQQEGAVEHTSSQISHIEALLHQSAIPMVITPIENSQQIRQKESKPSPDTQVTTKVNSSKVNSSKVKIAKVSAAKPSKPSALLGLLPPYQGKTLLNAIAQALQNYEGEKLTADEVVKELHGDLSTDLFRLAKERITKNLSKGKLEKKWESVPNQTGFYTFSLNTLRS